MPNDKGFSLVEMAVVMVVFSLLLGGMMMPLAKQTQFRREREARKQINAIVEALYGYALIHQSLPPPVDSDADGAADDLPWTELGAPETDPWGRPWGYRAVASLNVCNPDADATIQVQDSGGGNTVNALAVVVSGGRRNHGSAAEQENRDGDDVFVRDDPVKDQFDDVAAWIHPTVLANRAVLAGMCNAGK